ncbi:hypothetical protein HELRODRAFT_185437 [Helobdella robusta]|uniref:Sterol-4-alpha-carboxylate 3-dehydrogenase, decarboxylating n=1 Tax=Helobdella robusta TaxID=6412 RepID=T1FMT8_HELRO|nr:hypothetical protein HELRODRAFT_185437 [Helobdella robusta]ESO07497.1 hypothetical protein HELRODRAFT_185437 [Helobdella robusta]
MSVKAIKPDSKIVLVIGGSGFVGRHLVEKLCSLGYTVRVFDLRTTFEHEKVTFYNGDLCNKQDLLKCMDNVDTVFHCATPSPLSNNKKVFLRVNVDGTKNVLDACFEKGVKNLILTSSASVVYSGSNIEHGDETLPYAKRPLDCYTQTKIQQEKLVLSANSESLKTIALRPHGIFGPRDPHMLPTTARLAAAGKTKFIIGKGINKVDFTYIDNVVYAHVLAAQQLQQKPEIAGNAYNITNNEPILFWEFMSRLLKGLGYAAPKYHLPYYFIYFLAFLVQIFVFIVSPFKTIRPTLTTMTVALAGTHHYYSCEKAASEFNYSPVVKLEDAIERTLQSVPELHNKHAKKVK